MIANEGGAITCKSYVPASLDSLTQTMRSGVTTTGGSEIWNISLTVEILRSNLTGVSNTIAVPVGKRMEGVSLDSKGSIHYSYRRGMSEQPNFLKLLT